ncbi:MAG: hypothetical protein HQL06_10165 [Nitrospirae bacterium]|nr:hypothetical protein [Nitrospirota bacterium]
MGSEIISGKTGKPVRKHSNYLNLLNKLPYQFFYKPVRTGKTGKELVRG